MVMTNIPRNHIHPILEINTYFNVYDKNEQFGSNLIHTAFTSCDEENLDKSLSQRIDQKATDLCYTCAKPF